MASQSEIGVGMIGCGTVGAAVASLLRDEAALYAHRAGRPIKLRRVLVRDTAKARGCDAIDPATLTDDPEQFFATDDMPIVIEVAGGAGPVSGYVRRALESGKHVATANKSLLAAEGTDLFALARKHDVSIAFEASCAGGIPCVTALQQGLMANEIRGLYGILNGTCNFILSAMTQRAEPYANALKEAQDLGYAEADPTLDVSGADAAQKLAILASLAFGADVREQHVRTAGIDTLELDDIRFGRELDYDIKLLAIAERTGDDDKVALDVEPCFIHDHELLAKVDGAYNALSVYGHAVGHTMQFGPGAGGMPTASAVVSDLLNIASGWYPVAFSQMRLTPDANGPAHVVPREQLRSRFYLRVTALDVPGTMARITSILGESKISLSAVLQHESEPGEFVPVVITTHEAQRGDIDKAVQRIRELDVIDGDPRVLRIVDMPE